MAKIFMSMSSTFRSFVEGKITVDDIRGGILHFGPHKDAIASEAAIPVFATSFNTEKPKYGSDAEYVDAASLDKEVAEKWLKFKLLVRDAERNDRVQWSDGKNYPGKIHQYLAAGHEVFWEGCWQQMGHYKHLVEGE